MTSRPYPKARDPFARRVAEFPSMPAVIQDRLDEWGTILLDGGLATELERRGHDLDHPLWSARLLLENPGAVRSVHDDYLEAGAHVIATATYQATLPGLKKQGLGDAESAAVLRRAVDLAVESRDRFVARHRGCGRPPGGAGPQGDADSEPALPRSHPPADRPASRARPLVAASIGPYGAFLADGSEYSGDYGNSRNAFVQFHRERLEILTKSPADLLAFETIPSLAETEALAELLGSIQGPPAWISFQCRDGAHLADGALLVDAVRLADSVPDIVAIGINCVPPHAVPALIAAIRSASSKPVAVYPNSGEVFHRATRHWSGTADPAAFASAALQWREAGASLIGGCCRTTPAHIRALRRALFPHREGDPPPHRAEGISES